jgi:hypothetical protein
MLIDPSQHRHDGMTTSSEAAAAVTETIVPVMSSSTAIGDVGKQDEDDDTREEHRRRDESDAIRLTISANCHHCYYHRHNFYFSQSNSIATTIIP